MKIGGQPKVALGVLQPRMPEIGGEIGERHRGVHAGAHPSLQTVYGEGVEQIVDARPLSPAAVRDIVRERAKIAGLPEVFSAHSLRSGFVTEAAVQKVPLADTMAMTGHKSVASVVGYYRPSADNPAAKLL